LRDVSFKIFPGEKIALAGSSGSGKSTVIQLLMRFYRPNKGVILVDGVDIQKYSIDSLRYQYGLVGQEPFLFNNTIFNNIKYNNANVTMEEVRHASEISNAINFIERDEKVCTEVEIEKKEKKSKKDNYKDEVTSCKKEDAKGFNRNVGLKGSKLSGGQKQRVAIARCVVRDPKIYLFDEATSALDSKTEMVVLSAMEEVSKGKTS